MFSEFDYPCGRGRLILLLASVLVLPFAVGNAVAQDDGEEDDELIEEIITVGSQIRGANISDMHQDFGRSWYLDLRLDF